MKWFARRQPADIWDEPIQGPIGDIEAAERIRKICEAARAGAEAVGGSAQTDKRERDRFERAARVAMEIAMKIADDLMRDDAVRRIVDLCMKANDLKTAQILFRAIQAGWIREAVQRDYPALSE
jgi:isocitrate/isopropylmalate dehydrogenase